MTDSTKRPDSEFQVIPDQALQGDDLIGMFRRYRDVLQRLETESDLPYGTAQRFTEQVLATFDTQQRSVAERWRDQTVGLVQWLLWWRPDRLWASINLPVPQVLSRLRIERDRLATELGDSLKPKRRFLLRTGPKTELLKALEQFLEDTRPVFDAITETALRSFPDTELNTSAECIDRSIAEITSEFPPARVARLCAQFGPEWLDGFTQGTILHEQNALACLLTLSLESLAELPDQTHMWAAGNKLTVFLAKILAENGVLDPLVPPVVPPIENAGEWVLQTLETLGSRFGTDHEETETDRMLLALGRFVHVCALKELGLAIDPPLDQRTLRPAVHGETFERVCCRYAVSNRPTGEVLRVVRFARHDSPGEVVVSMGPGDQLSWALLPEPPRFESATDVVPELLETLRNRALMAHRGGQPTGQPSVAERDNLVTLLTGDGENWFHALAEAARSEDGSRGDAARDWIRGLAEREVALSYPRVDPDTRETRWPTEVPPGPDVVRTTMEHPPGVVVEITRFSPDPTRAVCVVSRGPARPGSPLDLASRLEEVLHRSESMRDAIGPALTRLTELSEEPGDQLSSMSVIEEVLAALPKLHYDPEKAIPPEEMDPFLDLLRSWAATQEIAILPREWKFALPSIHSDRLPEGEADIELVFRNDDPPGIVFRIIRFGTVGPTDLKPARVAVSAGKPPTGFVELQELISPPDGEIEAGLHTWLRRWRSASLNGTLESAAVQFFVELWDRTMPIWREKDPKKSDEFASCLARLLQRQFGLQSFRPSNYQDYKEGWVQLEGGARMTSGRIRRLLRPGLRDRSGSLRVPARVEAE